MGRRPGQDPQKLAERRQRIVEAAFPVFAERTIEPVTMNDVAEACGIGVATVYRHFSTKPELVLAVSTWAWERCIKKYNRRYDPASMTAAEMFQLFLDAFLDLYRNHRDLLRFNQSFNIYVQSERIPEEELAPYREVIGRLVPRFHVIYDLGRRDGTLRTDLQERDMFSAVVHLMLAAVTRYAVGLVYLMGPDPEKELILLRDLLLQRFLTSGAVP